jgi:hypothetical protein
LLEYFKLTTWQALVAASNLTKGTAEVRIEMAAEEPNMCFGLKKTIYVTQCNVLWL